MGDTDWSAYSAMSPASNVCWGFWVWNLGFRSRISGFGFRASGFRFRVSGQAQLYTCLGVISVGLVLPDRFPSGHGRNCCKPFQSHESGVPQYFRVVSGDVAWTLTGLYSILFERGRSKWLPGLIQIRLNLSYCDSLLHFCPSVARQAAF